MKKNRKIGAFSLLIVLSYLLCSCGFFSPQRYVIEIDEIKSIEIVTLDDYNDGEYEYEYIVLTQIEDHKSFAKELQNVKHHVNWGDPGVLWSGYTVIKIDYSNGDYDLIYHNAQWFHRSGKTNNGYFFFDEKQMNDLISKYL